MTNINIYADNGAGYRMTAEYNGRVEYAYSYVPNGSCVWYGYKSPEAHVAEDIAHIRQHGWESSDWEEGLHEMQRWLEDCCYLYMMSAVDIIAEECDDPTMTKLVTLDDEGHVIWANPAKAEHPIIMSVLAPQDC